MDYLISFTRILMIYVSDLWNQEEGEPIKFVYLRTACRSLTFPLLYVLTRVVKCSCFFLTRPLYVHLTTLSCYLGKVILAFSGLIVISKI